MKVSQAMHKGVEWVSPDTTLTELARQGILPAHLVD